MFGDLDYCNMVERRVLKILCAEFIVAKGSKMCGLYILYSSTIIIHASLASSHEPQEPTQASALALVGFLMGLHAYLCFNFIRIMLLIAYGAKK